MKTYEKPRLVALSLASDDMLCGTCEVDVMEETNTELNDLIGEFFPGVEGELFSDSISTCSIFVEENDKFPHGDETVFFVS